MTNLIGYLVFAAVLMSYLGYRTYQLNRTREIYSAISGVEQEFKEEKKEFNIPFFTKLYRDVLKSGFKLNPFEFTLMLLLIVLLGYFSFTITLDSTYGPIGAFIFIIMYKVYINGRLKKRIYVMREQFSSTLGRMSNYMKAHLSLEEALRQAVVKIDNPLRAELEKVLQIYETENNIIKALRSAEPYIPLDEYKLFVMGAEINREMGGNFPNLLEKMVQTVREKQEIAREIRTSSAHGKATASLVGILAIGTFCFFRFFLPSYLAPLLSSSLGLFILFYCIVSILLGWYIIRQMSDVSLE